MGLKWDQAEDIAEVLIENHPGLNPLDVRFTDLRQWVVDLDEFDVTPGRRAELAGIVVRIAAEIEAVVRYTVPFFARDFARLASDAQRRIRQKADLRPLRHEVMPRLISAFRRRHSFVVAHDSPFPCCV